MKKFWFDGECSATYGLMASGSGTYNAPERDIENISVPGRNGDLLIDNGRFKNIPVSYPISICQDFARNADEARAWLLCKAGYRRLEDEYNPDIFRMATFKGPINFDVQFLSRAGDATLTFDCKPQRFLVEGEAARQFLVPSFLVNPTQFNAKPLITVYGIGPGNLTVGNTTVQIKALEDQVTLDCEVMNAYRQVGEGAPENKNNTVRAMPFPELLPGENIISWDGGITSIEIIPRWWTL